MNPIIQNIFEYSVQALGIIFSAYGVYAFQKKFIKAVREEKLDEFFNF